MSTTAKPQPRSGDIVIRCLGESSFIIATIGGERLGTARDRVEAMRRACEVARAAGGYVWITEGVPEIYREVICP